MPGRVAQFITNCCHCHWTKHKKLYLTRHGQSEYNAMGRIGGDSDLTEMGERYALALKDFAETTICRDRETGKELPARLWTSSLKRTRRTARHIANPTIMRDGYPWIQMKPRVWSNLDEIYAGAGQAPGRRQLAVAGSRWQPRASVTICSGPRDHPCDATSLSVSAAAHHLPIPFAPLPLCSSPGACDGMTYREIEEQFAKEAAARKKDKLTYRYPRGESYLDVIQRLEPLIQEIERHREPLMIVGHQGVLRMILAYYKGIPREEAPHQTLKLNHVTELIPHAYGCDEKVYNLLPDENPGDDGQTKH